MAVETNVINANVNSLDKDGVSSLALSPPGARLLHPASPQLKYTSVQIETTTGSNNKAIQHETHAAANYACFK